MNVKSTKTKGVTIHSDYKLIHDIGRFSSSLKNCEPNYDKENLTEDLHLLQKEKSL